MKPLSPPDTLFLLIERRNQPMHVGGLILVRPPKNAGPEFFSRIVARSKAATKAYPPFNLRLKRKLGVWCWEEDQDFDIEAHVNHIALPQPGRIRELLALVSRLHSGLMDRGKPLWEAFFIEGIEDGRAALYFKIHHSLADGVAAARMFRKVASSDPNDTELTPVWAIPPSDKVDVKKATDSIFQSAFSMAKEQMIALPKVAVEVGRSLRAAKTDPDFVTVNQAPQTILNQEITGSRRFAAQSWKLDRLKKVAKHFGVTLNDVVLAMCGGALRTYLKEMNALPNKPLIAMVPVSLRRDDSESGNQVAMVLANLGTHLIVPEVRLRAVARSMQNSKKRFAGMSQLEILEYVSTIMALPGLNILTGAAPKRQAFNIVISNVPGPKETLYFNGAKVEGVYPVSIVIDGQALNITLESYADKLEVGLVACSRTVPRMQRLLQFLEDALAELEAYLPTAAAEGPKGSRKKTGAKTPAKAKPKPRPKVKTKITPKPKAKAKTKAKGAKKTRGGK